MALADDERLVTGATHSETCDGCSEYGNCPGHVGPGEDDFACHVALNRILTLLHAYEKEHEANGAELYSADAFISGRINHDERMGYAYDRVVAHDEAERIRMGQEAQQPPTSAAPSVPGKEMGE